MTQDELDTVRLGLLIATMQLHLSASTLRMVGAPGEGIAADYDNLRKDLEGICARIASGELRGNDAIAS